MTPDERWNNGYKAGYAQAQETDLAMPRKEWVGLTDEEVLKEFWNIYPEEDVLFTDVERAFYRAIENKLKEKNA